MKLKIVTIICFLILLIFLLSVLFQVTRYAFIIRKETKERCEMQVLLLKDASFEANVMDKITYNNELGDSFVLRLRYNSTVFLPNKYVIPCRYYRFINDTILDIEVPEDIYNTCNYFDLVSKQEGSCNIVVGDKHYWITDLE